MTFGEKLKLLRYEKGLTQDDLGYILNVTKSCISCYENGSRQPSIDILTSLSIFFKVSIDFLVGNEEYDTTSRKDVRLTKKDIEFIKELKNHPTIYKKIISSIPKSISAIQKIFN